MSEDPLALSKISAAPPAETDYEAICAAVMETERGRWFLNEYARRNRHADTGVLLSAIGRIESAIRGEEVSPDSSHLRLDLLDMAEVIARTEAEMAAIKPGAGHGGHSGGDHAAQRSPNTSAEVLAAAERVLDIVWTLREREVDSALCDALHAAASEIHAAGEHQDFTALRADRAMQVLHHLEGRITALIDAWGDSPAAAKTAANGAVAAEHEPADIDVADRDLADRDLAEKDSATADRFDVAATVAETEAGHETEPQVHEPLVLDLDPLLPAEPQREPEADVAAAVAPPVEEASLIDEAAAMIASASELADVGAAALDRQAPAALDRQAPAALDREAEVEPADTPPETRDAPAELAAVAADPPLQSEPPAVAAPTPIVFAAATPPVFVLFQASESIADVTVPDAPVPPPEPPTQIGTHAAEAAAIAEPGLVETVVDDLTAADPIEPPIEAHHTPPSHFVPEREQAPSEAEQAFAEAEVPVESEAASTLTESQAVPLASASEAAPACEVAYPSEATDVAQPVELEIEPAASVPVAHAATEPEPPRGDDDHDLEVSSEAPPAVEQHSVFEQAPAEDIVQVAAVALPGQETASPAVEIATQPEIEMAIIEAVVSAELADPSAPTTEYTHAPPPVDAAEPTAIDDIEFLLEPLSSPAAPTPEPAATAPEAAIVLPEPSAPLPEATMLLPEIDEDPADLFETLPEPRPEAKIVSSPIAHRPRDPAPAIEAAAAEILAPAAIAAPMAAAHSNDASAEFPIAPEAATMPQATLEAAPVASAVVQAETAPAAVATPAAAPPSRVAARPILTQRVTPNDPMAAVRALSDDELIALFS